MLTEAVLRGYVLEEVLARLLRDNGYSLLVSAEQDRDALTEGHHGLLVRGRGTDHQVDALGELQIPTPFSPPLRLFAEAKFRDEAVDITAVRNAVGLLYDINEYHRSQDEDDLPLRRFHYRYALFSTKGFTLAAQRYALAHQISLIDLQGPAFADLRAAAADTTRRLLELARASGITSFPLNQMRTAMRRALGTWTADGPAHNVSFDASLSRALRAEVSANAQLAVDRLPAEPLARIAAHLSDDLREKLLLGFPQGPFVLVLQPDDPEAFDTFLRHVRGEVPVHIQYATRSDGASGEWAIVPNPRREELVVRFGIPPVLDGWLLAAGSAEAERARQAKKTLFSTISLFHHGNRLIRLRYTKIERAEPLTDSLMMEEVPPLRRDLAAPDLAFTPERRERFHTDQATGVSSAHGPQWTVEGIRALVERLEIDGYFQAEVIYAAAQQHGQVSREQVYELGELDPDRTLRGFPLPITRVTRQLQREGLVADGVPPILRTVHGPDSRATRFVIPEAIQPLVTRALA